MTRYVQEPAYIFVVMADFKPIAAFEEEAEADLFVTMSEVVKPERAIEKAAVQKMRLSVCTQSKRIEE